MLLPIILIQSGSRRNIFIQFSKLLGSIKNGWIFQDFSQFIESVLSKLKRLLTISFIFKSILFYFMLRRDLPWLPPSVSFFPYTFYSGTRPWPPWHSTRSSPSTAPSSERQVWGWRCSRSSGCSTASPSTPSSPFLLYSVSHAPKLSSCLPHTLQILHHSLIQGVNKTNSYETPCIDTAPLNCLSQALLYISMYKRTGGERRKNVGWAQNILRCTLVKYLSISCTGWPENNCLESVSWLITL